MTDQEIFNQICRGNEQALEIVYKRNYQMMVQLVQKNSGTEQEAKDIYQEAVVVFWEKAVSGKLVLTSKISTYLYSICFNLWRKELDRKKRHTNKEHDSPSYQQHETEEKAKIVRACINQLGETCRKILFYYYFDGISMKEIAERVGFANTNTAKTKKYKCKKKLDKIIKSQYSAKDFLD